ncbi:hypothetical protein [Acetobacter sp. DmW_136]|nr:hypothetical protein [Acetobacter sp. DmW_136]
MSAGVCWQAGLAVSLWGGLRPCGGKAGPGLVATLLNREIA